MDQLSHESLYGSDDMDVCATMSDVRERFPKLRGYMGVDLFVDHRVVIGLDVEDTGVSEFPNLSAYVAHEKETNGTTYDEPLPDRVKKDIQDALKKESSEAFR